MGTKKAALAAFLCPCSWVFGKRWLPSVYPLPAQRGCAGGAAAHVFARAARKNMAAIRLQTASVMPLLGVLSGKGARDGRKERGSTLGDEQNMAAIRLLPACLMPLSAPWEALLGGTSEK